MKWLPILGAVLALALVGASSASASTVLCKTQTSPCPAGQEYPVGTKVTSQVQGVLQIWKSTVPRSECASGKLNGEVTSSGINFTEFALSCGGSYQTCTYTGKAMPWSSVLSAGTGGNGALTVSSARFSHTCSKLYLPGDYEATNFQLQVLGTSGEPARIQMNTTFKALCCSETQRLEGTFKITSPSPLYVENQ
jgi:hypothetical protein